MVGSTKIPRHANTLQSRLATGDHQAHTKGICDISCGLTDMMVSAIDNMYASAYSIHVCVVECAHVRVCACKCVYTCVRLHVGMRAAMYERVCPCSTSHMPLCIYVHPPLYLPVCINVCRGVDTPRLLMHASVRACHMHACVSVGG